MRAVVIVLAVLFAASPVVSETREVSHSARERGLIIVRELTVKEGKILFRADSNGCTDRSSFSVEVAKDEGFSPKSPHYRLTIERIRSDECKAMVWDGILIEIDLEKELGLTITYTVSVENPVFPKFGGAQ
jgi:hypothetical protein